MVWFYDCKKEKEKKVNDLLCCGACFGHHSPFVNDKYIYVFACLGRELCLMNPKIVVVHTPLANKLLQKWMAARKVFCCTIELFLSRVDSLVADSLVSNLFWKLVGSWRFERPCNGFLGDLSELIFSLKVRADDDGRVISNMMFCSGYNAFQWLHSVVMLLYHGKIVHYFVSCFFGSQTLMSLKDKSVE